MARTPESNQNPSPDVVEMLQNIEDLEQVAAAVSLFFADLPRS